MKKEIEILKKIIVELKVEIAELQHIIRDYKEKLDTLGKR